MLQNNPRLTTNNFDLLRLLFAGTVFLVHVYVLSGYQQLSLLAAVFSASVAVKGFFVVSGFLIFMSFERSPSLFSYTGKRFKRIYPAYFAVVVLCAISLTGVTTKSPADYFSSAWIKYIFANLSFLNFLHPTLPGVFENNRIDAVNGALWTLKIEVMFYLSVPLFVYLFRRFGKLPVIIIVYIISVSYAMILSWSATKTGSDFYLRLGRQLPGQLSYFIAGSFFYYYLPFFQRYVRFFLFSAIFVLTANKYLPLAVLEPLALATVVIFFGLFLYLGNFGKYGDFSYGIYILHFPIIQYFLWLGWPANQPWLFLFATATTTLMAAIAMWHLIEKRFLARNSHYVGTTTRQTTGKTMTDK